MTIFASTTIRDRRSLFLAIAILAAVACSDSTEPSVDSSGPVEIGDGIEVHVPAGGSMIGLTFQAKADSMYVVVVGPEENGVSLQVVDSVTGTVIGYSGSISTSAAGYQRATRPFVTAADGPYTVKVTGSFENGSVARITVERVKLKPEKVGQAITIGTTVSGETLANDIDLDRFTFTAVAGQIIEPWLTFPTGSTAEVMACLTVESLDTVRLGRTEVAPVGSPVASVNMGGRITLPVSGTYTATMSSSWNRCNWFLPYVGGYTIELRPIDPAPEDVPATLAVGDTITGESIDAIGDLDRYTLTGPAGSQVVLFLQTLGTGDRALIRLEVPGVTAIGSSPADTSLDQRATARVTFPDSGKLTVTLMGVRDGPGGDTGPYRFNAYPVNLAPEHNPAAMAIGDSIGFEDIERLGDIDRFTFAGVAGQFVNVSLFKAGVPNPNGGTLALRILAPNGDTLPNVATLNLFPGPTDSASAGRAQLPATGTYTIDLRGALGPDLYGSQWDISGYRFNLFGIDTLPEIAPAAFTLGDSIIGETVDRPGDIDLYSVEQAHDTLLKIWLTLEPGATGDWVLMALYNPVTGDTIKALTSYGGSTTEVGPLQVPAGSYRISVQGMEGPTSDLHGTYSIRTSAFLWGPETAPDTIAVGDTVTTESIDALGDVDQFSVVGTKGQSIEITMAGDGGVGTQVGIGVSLSDVGGPDDLGIHSPRSQVALGTYRSGRIDIARDGLFGIRVTGSLGGYQFVATPTDIEPEDHTVALAVGDTVADESIDVPGDLDRFFLTGTPGALIMAVFTAVPGTGYPLVQLRDSATGDLLRQFSGSEPEVGLGSLRIPASGSVEIKVFQVRSYDLGCLDPACSSAYSYTGAYAFRTQLTDSLPEVASPVVTIGDTVAGEALDPIGDIDEFTFEGTAGQALRVYIRANMDVSIPAGAVLQVIDTTNGNVLRTVDARGTIFNLSAPFTLPYTGQYRIRVAGDDDWRAHGDYLFVVRPAP